MTNDEARIQVLEDCKGNYRGILSQLYYGPVVTYCMVYHYTKRATLARLLANKGPAIYVVQVFCYTSMILFSSHFL